MEQHGSLKTQRKQRKAGRRGHSYNNDGEATLHLKKGYWSNSGKTQNPSVTWGFRRVQGFFRVQFYLLGCVSSSGLKGKQTKKMVWELFYMEILTLKMQVRPEGEKREDSETSFQRCIFTIRCDLEINIQIYSVHGSCLELWEAFFFSSVEKVPFFFCGR